MPPRKLHCLLCGGPVAYDGDPGRLQDHLRRDHEATAEAGLDWVLAGSLMERGRREAVLAAILSNTAAPGGGDSEPGDTSPGTKVILNIDISDDDQEDCSSGPAGTGSEWFPNNSTEKDENMREQGGAMTVQEESLHASKDLSDDTFEAAMSERRKNTMEKSSWKEMKSGKDVGDDSDLIHKSMQGSVTVEEAVGDHEIIRGTGDNPRKHIECEFCDFKADTNFKLRNHMKKVHSMSSFIKFAKAKDKKEESVQKTTVSDDLQRKMEEFSKLLSGPPEDARQCGDSSVQSNKPPHKKRRVTFEKDEMLVEEDSKISSTETQKQTALKKTSKSKNIASASKDKKITENLKLSAMKNKVEVQLKEICNSPKDQDELVDNSSVGNTEEDFEKLKKDFSNVGPTVNISGSVYFQMHKSVIKQLSKSSLKDFNMKTLQRDSNLPDNWFNVINYFDGCKRTVRDFMTPDRQVIRTKTGVIEFMKISNLYSEEEVSRVSNYLDTRQKKVK